MHLLTSNFNLLHTNSNWLSLKNKNFYIDSEFNNFFLILNNSKKTEKFETLHVVLHLNKKNSKEIIKKINELKKNNYLKNIFIYIISNLNKSKLRNFNKKINLKINKNIFFKLINNNKILKINKRNQKHISFPYDILGVNEISNKVIETLNIFYTKPYKLIILDCDNTLWGGILDEDKMQNILYSIKGVGKIYRDFQIYLKSLKDKGFILSICSKNNMNNVWNFMKSKNMVLQKKDFLSAEINWQEKSNNIGRILKKLSLRADDTLFIDDNMIEIKKVKNNFKKINCLHFKSNTILSNLNNDNRLKKLKILKEDKTKYRQYKLKSKYEKLKSKEIFKKNENSFFKSLYQKVKFVDCNLKNIDRTIQLVTKTNQFNFSLSRYKIDDLHKMRNDKKYLIKLIDFKDKFGSHGLVGLIIVKNEKDVYIKDLILSCRILYRKIEDYIIYYILRRFRNKKILIEYNNSILNNKLIPIFLKNSFFKFYKKEGKKKIYKIVSSKSLYASYKIFN